MALIEAVNANTFKVAKIGSVESDLVLGGIDLDKFIPNINASFKFQSSTERYWWNINAKNVIVKNQKPVFNVADKSITLTIGDIQEKYFLASDESGKQLLKWVRVFSAHPGTNVFEHELKFALGTEFLYQPPLTEEQVLAGIRQAPNVAGSYAVYCPESGHFLDSNKNTIVNFRAGKMGMIYPHTYTDADGKQIRGTLFIDPSANILVETVDQSWFNSAKFPVIANANFGYETIGGQSDCATAGYTYYLQLNALSPAGSNNMTAVAVASQGAAASTAKMALYSEETDAPHDRLAVESSAFTFGSESSQFFVRTLSYSLVASTQYWAAIGFVSVPTSGCCFWDTSGSKDVEYQGSSLPATAASDGEIATTAKPSAYVTYEASGGASASVSETLNFAEALD